MPVCERAAPTVSELISGPFARTSHESTGRVPWRGRGYSGPVVDPGFPPFPDLFLPDRDDLFQSVNRIFAGFEGGFPMWSTNRDSDTALADLEVSDAMYDRDVIDGPFLVHFISDLL